MLKRWSKIDFQVQKNVCIFCVPETKKNPFCSIRRNACILWVWMGHFEVKWWILFLCWSCEISQSTLLEELVAIRLHTVAILTWIRIYQQPKEKRAEAKYSHKKPENSYKRVGHAEQYACLRCIKCWKQRDSFMENTMVTNDHEMHAQECV